ncbi:MAG: hypothetical protein JWM04_2666 [Verrucomicrobiales bacterium]|nr:hypothetical protein [Verrucomicrobiales bacterium]
MSESPQPVGIHDRIRELDVIRGFALFGVLLVNCLTLFRVSFAARLEGIPKPPLAPDHWTELIASYFFEFKAITLFSLLFGVGSAIQWEKATLRHISPFSFLTRRYLVLLFIGLIHMIFLWNGDILCLYAVCGLLILPLYGLSSRSLVIAGLALVILGFSSITDGLFPSSLILEEDKGLATAVYSSGTYMDILRFRIQETGDIILPLLIITLPRTCGVFLLGAAAWKSGLLKNVERYRLSIALGGIVLVISGCIATFAIVWSQDTNTPLGEILEWAERFSYLPLGIGYGALIFSCLTARLKYWPLPELGAVGQMALTNYLLQSVVLTWVFYGYGLGYFGKLGSAICAALCVTLFAAQCAYSRWWLRRFEFGPVEWMWRSLTYGKRQQFTKIK